MLYRLGCCIFSWSFNSIEILNYIVDGNKFNNNNKYNFQLQELYDNQMLAALVASTKFIYNTFKLSSNVQRIVHILLQMLFFWMEIFSIVIDVVVVWRWFEASLLQMYTQLHTDSLDSLFHNIIAYSQFGDAVTKQI